jgi:hypothetical protein
MDEERRAADERKRTEEERQQAERRGKYELSLQREEERKQVGLRAWAVRAAPHGLRGQTPYPPSLVAHRPPAPADTPPTPKPRRQDIKSRAAHKQEVLDGADEARHSANSQRRVDRELFNGLRRDKVDAIQKMQARSGGHCAIGGVQGLRGRVRGLGAGLRGVVFSAMHGRGGSVRGVGPGRGCCFWAKSSSLLSCASHPPTPPTKPLPRPTSASCCWRR